MRSRAVRTVLIVAIGAVLALAGCSAQSPSSAEDVAADIVAAAGFAGVPTPQIIEQLESTALDARPGDLMASVRPEALVLTDADGREAALAMPADRFYLSVAPYLAQTHECFFHSLTTCEGELRGEKVDIRVVGDDGSVLVATSTTTNDNGFVGVWLPRDIEGTLTIEHAGRTATTAISTGADDPTCLTTARLV